MMMLGRKPAVHTRRTMRAAIATARRLDALGSPPDASNDYAAAVTVDWGMLGNDAVGDCVWADTGHTLMLRTANASSIVVPTAADVLAAYSDHTGYDPADPSTDHGDDETSACEYLERVGFLGHKSNATGVVDPANIDHVKWCVQLFGACRLGVNLPRSAMDQFNDGTAWDDVGDTEILGGHDVPLVGYAGDVFTCVTWGRLVPVTRTFVLKYVEEAHSELYFDWIAGQGTAPSGLSLDQLVADLGALS